MSHTTSTSIITAIKSCPDGKAPPVTNQLNLQKLIPNNAEFADSIKLGSLPKVKFNTNRKETKAAFGESRPCRLFSKSKTAVSPRKFQPENGTKKAAGGQGVLLK